MPDHSHVVRRPEPDTLLLKHAESAGAELRESAKAVGRAVDDDSWVVGVTLKSGDQVLADAVIAVDG